MGSLEAYFSGEYNKTKFSEIWQILRVWDHISLFRHFRPKMGIFGYFEFGMTLGQSLKARWKRIYQDTYI